MTDIDKMREFLKGFPGTDARPNYPNEFTIDHVSESPFSAGLHSNGTMEIGRRKDIAGNLTLTLQSNFSFAATLEKDINLDDLSKENADWIIAFQNWVMEESIAGRAPKFGDVDIDNEIIRAQNGMFAGIPADGSGRYMTTITVQFKKYYRRSA